MGVAGSLSDQTAERLRQYILQNEFASGDQLPTERQLAQTLGVSRTVVREAVRSLSTLGIVTTRQGGGIYLAEQTLRPVVQQIAFRWQQRRPRLAELFEARSIMELAAVELAAKRATPQDLERLRQISDRIAEAVREGRSYQELDAAFHRALVSACRNEIVSEFAGIVGEFFTTLKQTSEAKADRRHLRDHTLTVADHQRLIEALAEGDCELARALLRRHLARAKDLVDVLEEGERAGPGLGS